MLFYLNIRFNSVGLNTFVVSVPVPEHFILLLFISTVLLSFLNHSKLDNSCKVKKITIAYDFVVVRSFIQYVQ